MGRRRAVKHLRAKGVSPRVIGPFLVAVLIMAFSFFHPCPVWPAGSADILSVDVEGAGIIDRQNLSQARERAVESALSQALKAAVAQVLRPGLPPSKAEEAWRAVSPNRGRYIQKYAITGETSDGRVYRVGVSVTLLTGILSERLQSLGYEIVRSERADREVTLTVRDVRSHEEYVQLRAFLKAEVPCVREVRPARFSWKEVSFRLILQGTSLCVTEVQLPFVVRELTDDAITGEIVRRK